MSTAETSAPKSALETTVEALGIGLQAGIPILAWGDPGVGKTSVINALAKKIGRHLETVLASIREPADFSGLPVVDNGSTSFAPPSWARALATEERVSNPGILFLDEISTAPPAVQAALLRVILERVVGDLALPAGTGMIAAANPAEVAAGGFELGAPLANRLCHLDWGIDRSTWCQGMVSGFAEPSVLVVPDDWKTGIPYARALIASFIERQTTDKLLQVPSDAKSAGLAWPSPRTWDMASQLKAACGAAGASLAVEKLLVKGCVGHVANEFYTWLDEQDLPDPEALLENPGMFRLPERGDRTYVILNTVASAVVEKNTVDRWSSAWQVIGRAVKAGAEDVGVTAARVLTENRPEGLNLSDLPAQLASDISSLMDVLVQASRVGESS